MALPKLIAVLHRLDFDYHKSEDMPRLNDLRQQAFLGVGFRASLNSSLPDRICAIRYLEEASHYCLTGFAPCQHVFS
jgi:hypothetical protein